MRVYFSTVIRCSPVDRGGELVLLDWEAKRVVGATPIRPTDPDIEDPNPRGNSRGGRGIHLRGDEVIAASYHTLRIFDRDLHPRRAVSNGLMVGLHEVHPGRDSTVWVTSTSIDAALEVDLQNGSVSRQIWPRESVPFQQALDVAPLPIDKAADNRARFLDSQRLKSAGHLHLNAVASWRSELYGLFNAQGAIANLDRERIVVRSPELVGAHNLLIDAAGVATVNDTRRRKIRKFDLSTGKALGVIDLLAFPWVRRQAGLNRGARQWVRRLRRFTGQLMRKAGVSAAAAARPLFVRGLDRVDGLLFAGLSPAAIICIDERSGAFVDGFAYSRDVEVCVHGLKVAP